MNGVWHVINIEGVLQYLSSVSFKSNRIIIFIFVIISDGFKQIKSLQRKRELFNFISGKYHPVIEINRIFCFIDLLGYTSIAENLGL